MNIPNLLNKLSVDEINLLKENVDALSDEDIFCMYGFDKRYSNSDDASTKILVENLMSIHATYQPRIVTMIKSGVLEKLRSEKGINGASN